MKKTLQEMIKDLTNITVEEDKIKEYLENEKLNLFGANLSDADLSGVKITKEQLKQLIIVDLKRRLQ